MVGEIKMVLLLTACLSSLFCIVTTISVVLIVRSNTLHQNNIDPILSFKPAPVDIKKITRTQELLAEQEQLKKVLDRG